MRNKLNNKLKNKLLIKNLKVMKKKFTMLLASLFLTIGTAWAQMPVTSTAPADGQWNADTRWYTISGDGGKYVSLNYVDANGNFKLNNTTKPGLEGLWCVVGDENNGYQFYNYKSGVSTVLGATGTEDNGRMKMYDVSGTETGVTRSFDIKAIDGQTGYAFVKNHGSGNDWWNQRNGYLAYWNSSNAFSTGCTGSQYVFTEIVDFAEFVGVEGLKTAAKENLTGLKNVTALFTEANLDAAIAEVDNVTVANVGSLEEVVEALETLDGILGGVYSEVDGKYVRFTTYGRNTNNGGVDLTAVAAGGSETANSGDAGIWKLSYDAGYGGFKMYNFVSDLYLGTTSGQSSRVTTCADFAAATPYRMNGLAGNNANLLNSSSLMNAGNTLHANGWGSVVQWNDNTSDASIWKVIACDPIVIDRDQYVAATAARAALPWAIQEAYGLVKDPSKFSSNAKQSDEGTYEGLLDNFYDDNNNGVKSYFHSTYNTVVSDYHYLQAELSEEGTEFYFYFKKRQGNNNNRPTEIDIMGSPDGQTFTKITTINSGLPTDANDIDYLSAKITATENVRHLRFVVKETNNNAAYNQDPDYPFFTFSEFYIFPAGYGVSDLVDDYNTFASLSITDEGMVAAASALTNAENTLALANIKKEANALLTANADKYEVTPALGKYPTATYEALRNACNNGTTEAEIRTAIDNFKKSLNKPVYIITSAWDAGYPGGSSIYYDGAWKWKKTNKFDHQMWMTIPGYTEANVPVVDTYDAAGTSYAICDYLTGTKMRGKDVQIVKVPNWEGAYSLQYAASGQDAAQHAQQGGALVNWHPAQNNDRQASAWRVEYVGNTYDLDQLTDAYLSALSDLEAAVITNYGLFYAEEGNGLGQYQGDLDPMKDALLYGGQTVSLGFAALLTEIKESEITLEQIQNYTTAITETELNINQPSEGYYRIKGANQNVSPYAYYLTGKTNADGGRIALQAEADESTVFHYKDGKLRAVQSGLYVGLNSANYTFQLYAANAPTMTFGASTYAAGAYTIMSDRYLHYKIYNGEVELDRCDQNDANDAWYLEAVDEVPASNALTAIGDIDANATYRIYGERGFIYVANDGIMKGSNVVSTGYNPINDKQHFAIVTIDEKKYLYNVGAKKFVMKSGNVVALTDYPEHAMTIEAAATQTTDYDWLIKLNDKKMNLSDSGANGIYTEYETEDGGNRWAIYKVGTFNPDEAESMRKVVINYTVDGQTFTKTHGVALGTVFNFSYDFASVTSCKVNDAAQTITEGACSVNIQKNATIDVEIDQDLPFEATMNESKIPSLTWYYLQMNSNNKKYIEYLSDQNYIEWADGAVDADSEDSDIASHSWAFVGNVVEGFKMINFFARTTKALKMTADNPSMANLAEGTAFVLSTSSENVAGGFCMKRPDSDNYLNSQSGKVAYYGLNDAGSTFIATPSPVVPTRGKFYRIKNNGETGYLSSGTSGRTQFVAGIADAASSIFYYDGDRKLLSYDNGMYIDKDGGHLKYAANPGEGISFDFVGSAVADRLQIHYYTTEHRYLYSNGVGSTNSGRDAAYITSDASYRFIVEEVTTLPVTIKELGDEDYATFYTPVAVEIPEDVTASIITDIDGNEVVLEKVTGVVPAGTGLILQAQAGTYNFDIVTENIPAEFEKGLLCGAAPKTFVTAEDNTNYYVLAKKNDKVGLYKAALNQNDGTAFLNGANKVYLPVSTAIESQAPAMFSFGRGGEDIEGGTTGIDNVELEGETVIYDLTGRRIEKIVEKGIYIVNGRKVVIK